MDAVLQQILDQFHTLCAIPHPSGHEGAIAGYIADLLTDLGLSPQVDGACNVRCTLPAAPGREGADGVLLQAHTDMVCVHAAGTCHDSKNDPIRTRLQEGWLCSDGTTTLGADNGIGVALMLWLAQCRDEFPHGEVTLLFTACEETGLVGAKALNPNWLAGCKYYINLDAFRGDAAIFASAGGLRQSWERPLAWVSPNQSHPFRLTLSGLTGGHSGFDVHRGRANAIALLLELLAPTDWEVAELSGGAAINSIPIFARATVVTDDPKALATRCRLWEALARHKSPADPDLTLTVEPCPMPRQVFNRSDLEAITEFFSHLPLGVQAMREDLPFTVADSGNPAILTTQSDSVTLSHFARGAGQTWLDHVAEDTALWAQRTGFALTAREGYAPWEGSADNALTRLLPELDRVALHVGLEGSVLLEKAPGMTGVSLGFDIVDAHAVTERVRLDSIPVTAHRIITLLDQLSKEESR